MSNRVCFISKSDKDISKLKIPECIGGDNEIAKPFYEAERKCIFTYIKTIELYGDMEYFISPNPQWLEEVKKWAKENDLIITSDYALNDKYKKRA